VGVGGGGPANSDVRVNCNKRTCFSLRNRCFYNILSRLSQKNSHIYFFS